MLVAAAADAPPVTIARTTTVKSLIDDARLPAAKLEVSTKSDGFP